LLTAWAVCAQQPPTAGDLLKYTAPPTVAPAPREPLPALRQPAAVPTLPPRPGEAVRFRLEGLRFEGNSVYSAEALKRQAAEYLDREVDLEDLHQLAARIQTQYRRDGYILAQAYIPAQEVEGGTVTVGILEGRLGKIHVNRADNAPISRDQIDAILQPLKPGQVVKQGVVERVMLLLSDVPGISVQSSFEVGQDPGLTDLVVDVGLARRFNLQLDADNYGVPSSGEYRGGLGLRFNAPLGLGDRADLRILQTIGDLTYGSVGYEIPMGSRGLRLSAGYSYLTYGLGAAFFALDASGTAEVIGISASYPIIRSRRENLQMRLGADFKHLDDVIAAASTRNVRDLSNKVAGFEYERHDELLGGGFNGGSLVLTYGDVTFGDAQSFAIDQGPGGRSTAGGFGKCTLQISRLQRLLGRHNLFVGAVRQWATTNLDNVERIPVGGPQGVRAYAVSAVVADEATILRAEYRYASTPDVVLSAFYDWGWAKVNRNMISGQADNTPELQGAGIAIFWGKPGSFALTGSVAWRTTGPIPGADPDRTPMIVVQAVKVF
jgi:hemolysin activation/secretion protein